MNAKWLILVLVFCLSAQAADRRQLQFIERSETDASKGTIQTDSIPLFTLRIRNEILTTRAVCNYSRITGEKGYFFAFEYLGEKFADIDSVTFIIDGANSTLAPNDLPYKFRQRNLNGADVIESFEVTSTLDFIRRISEAKKVAVTIHSVREFGELGLTDRDRKYLAKFCDESSAFQTALLSADEIDMEQPAAPAITPIMPQIISVETLNEHQIMKYEQRADALYYASVPCLLVGILSWKLADTYKDAANLKDVHIEIGGEETVIDNSEIRNTAKANMTFFRSVSIVSFVATAGFMVLSSSSRTKAENLRQMQIQPKLSMNGDIGFNLALNF